MQYENNAVVQKLDTYYNSINSSNKAKRKIDALITLHEQPSMLDDLLLYERPDVEALDKLINSDLLIKYNDFIYQTELQHLETYRNSIDEDGLVEVRYRRKQPINFGRVFGKDYISAITLRREIRGTIFNKNYIDIDIANCHPAISLQLAKALNLECSNLEYYVENRNEVLELVQKTYNVNRDIAKNLFIRLLYSGTFSTWATDNNIKEPELEFIKNITEELKHLSLNFVKNNTELRKRVYAQRKLEKKDTRKENN
jgi:hypothetical protein